MAIRSWNQVGHPRVIGEAFLRRHWPTLGFDLGGGKPPRLFGKALLLADFEDPSGKPVSNFAMLWENPAAKKLALTRDGRVILVRQYKQGAGVCVEIPGGARDKPNETPEETAQRELLEETGYRPGKVIALGPPQYMSTRNSGATTQLLLALDCAKVQTGKLETSGEEIEVLLMPWEAWILHCHYEIVDPFSIVATFRAQPHVENHLRELRPWWKF